MAVQETEARSIDRYVGCIVGSAVGDALGAPVEFMSAEAIAEKHGVLREMIGGGHFGWRVGQTTDDTDHSMCLINSMLEKGVYDPEDIAGRMLEWYRGNPVDIGNTTRVSLRLLSEGRSWRECGYMAMKMGAGMGNGSLMRTEPIGLYFRGYTDDIDRAAEEISAITHADPNCVASCQIASQMVSLLASGCSREESVRWLRERYVAGTLKGEVLRKALNGDYNTDTSGRVLGTLGIALTAFLEAEDYEAAVIRAIRAGGDTDSQATVAGAFAGALWGTAPIPARWQAALNPFSAAELAEKAARLYTLNQQMGA